MAIKQQLLPVLLMLLIVGWGGAVEFNGLPIISGSAGTSWGNYRKDSPPIIKNVKITNGNQVKLLVSVAEDKRRSEAQIMDGVATLRFQDEREEVVLEEEEVGLWSGGIPESWRGRDVSVEVSVEDSFGNRALLVSEEPYFEKKTPELSLWVSDEDADEQDLRGSLDILEVYGAIDQKELTVKFLLDKDFSKGTLDPPFMHIYGGLVWGKEDLLDIFSATLFLYAPLFSFESFPTTFLYDLASATPYYKTVYRVEVDGKALIFHIPRTVAGEGGNGYKLVFGDIGVLSIRVRDDTTAATERPRGAMDLFENIVENWRLRQVILLEELERIRELYHFSELTPFVRVQVSSKTFHLPD